MKEMQKMLKGNFKDTTYTVQNLTSSGPKQVEDLNLVREDAVLVVIATETEEDQEVAVETEEDPEVEVVTEGEEVAVRKEDLAAAAKIVVAVTAKIAKAQLEKDQEKDRQGTDHQRTDHQGTDHQGTSLQQSNLQEKNPDLSHQSQKVKTEAKREGLKKEAQIDQIIKCEWRSTRQM
eukprot:TRINITY_DN551_c0_g2_i1.p2 TRINITY_DN551_c0_g2~~TRINITY_DN551_c0_g2_i1.p2  ORF type:complete len:177 (+),score=33.49 TRINITY_DN551_c0_g2_i1:139-669(+)